MNGSCERTGTRSDTTILVTEKALALSSRVLRAAGFVHGFSLRTEGDPLRPLSAAIGLSTDAVHQATQVHGARILRARGDPDATRREEADALVAAAPFAVGVRVADCVPVLVGDRASGVVAAIHAGWRGTVAGVIAAALDQMPAGAKVAAIGPCIGPCCFEVGADVGAQISSACGQRGQAGVVARRGGGGGGGGDKVYVDLRLAVRTLLRAAGVADADIDDVPGCTRCDAVRFHSYRRDGANAGRHLAVIGAR